MEPSRGRTGLAPPVPRSVTLGRFLHPFWAGASLGKEGPSRTQLVPTGAGSPFFRCCNSPTVARKGRLPRAPGTAPQAQESPPCIQDPEPGPAGTLGPRPSSLHPRPRCVVVIASREAPRVSARPRVPSAGHSDQGARACSRESHAECFKTRLSHSPLRGLVLREVLRHSLFISARDSGVV